MSDSARENQASTPPSSLLKRVGAVILLFALVLIGAEATVRVEDRIRWGTPFLSGDTAISDLVISDSTGRHPAPGRSFQKWRINSVGTRGPEPDPALADHR